MAIAVREGAEMLLFDCGEGTQRQFMRSIFSYMKVDKVFLSHLHGDHFLGLPGLIQSMNFSGRERPLEVYGPRGVEDMVSSILVLGYFDMGFDVYVRELHPGDMVEGEGYSVKAVEVDHIAHSLGYVLQGSERPGRFLLERAKVLGSHEGPDFSRLQRGEPVTVAGRKISPTEVLGPARPGTKMVYSGDTLPSAVLEEAAQDCDVLIHEATVESSLEEKAQLYGHSSARQAAQIAKRVHAKHLFLVHCSGRYEDATPLLREAQEIFSASYLPNDLDLFELSSDGSKLTVASGRRSE